MVLTPASRVQQTTMHTFLICVRYSEKVTDGGVGIREHKHNQIDLQAMEEGRIKKKEGRVLNSSFDR